MRRYNYKKKNRLMLLLILVLGIAIGYSLLSTDLKITGFSGINKNTWDIHWDSESIRETDGSVAAKTAAHVTPSDNKNVDFNVELELPGDFYEFTLDAKNYGSVDGVVDDIDIKVYVGDNTLPTPLSSLPSYYKYSFTYADGSEVEKGEILRAGKSEKYKFRIEFDKDATEIPTNPEDITPSIVVPYNQTPDKQYYAIDYDANGGSVKPGASNIERGKALGSVPTATKEGAVFQGWYENEVPLPGDTAINGSTVPTKNTTYYAQWLNLDAEFDTGKNVNTKFKTLAGDELNTTNPYLTEDTNITSIVRSTTEPDDGIKTDEHKVSSPNSEAPIYAWYDNGTIYWWTNGAVAALNKDSSYMFDNMLSVTSIDTSFYTSSVTNMSNMFAGVGNATIDLSNFNTGNVTDMSSMFMSSKISTINLSSFNTGKVKNMGSMFANSTTSTLDLSNFNTKKVTNMSAMFASSKVTSLDLSNFDISNVDNIGSIFGGASELTTLNISGWNFNKVTSLAGFFSGTSKLETLNISNVNTSKITNMAGMFGGCSSLVSLDLSGFNVSKVTSFGSMFGGCSNLETLNISGWNFNSITSLAGFFYSQGLTKLATFDMSNANTSTITSMASMFYGLTALTTLNLTGINTSSVTNMQSMFLGCTSLKTLDLSSFNVTNVTNMNGIFGSCTSLETLNISGWNFNSYGPASLMMNMSNGGFAKLKTFILDNVVLPANMNYGFGGLTSVEEFSFNGTDTSNVTNMGSMFNGCTNITSLDLSSFNTSRVTNMSYMFNGDYNLETIMVSDDFVVTQVNDSSSMFNGCTSLVGGLGTEYDSTHIDKAYAHYDRGEADPGYFNAGETVTVTFNPNGGTVTPTTKKVGKGGKIGKFPVAVKDGKFFKGWYLGIDSGEKIDKDYVVNEDITIYAHYYDDINITYDANEGKFSNNETTNEITYNYGSSNVVKYSHTANIDDTGVASSDYGNSLNDTDVVTIEGAEQLEVEVWFTTESSCDWLAIYSGGITPDQSNYSSSITGGKLTGYGSYSGHTKPNDSDTTYHRTFTVEGDTVQFYFKSDGSVGYYGYYAIVRAQAGGYIGNKTYQEPTRVENKFLGWTKNSDGSGTLYKTEKDVIKNIEKIGNNSTIYAKWIDEYTITFDANTGTVDESSRKVVKGNKIGALPIPEKLDHAFEGWYTEKNGGVEIKGTYRPESSRTLYAHWNSIDAVFDTGKSVSIKFKALAGDTLDSSYPEYTTDDNIKEIRRSSTQPDLTSMTEANIVSSSTSSVPIYAWFDDGTIYWWSSADREFTNQDASYMFSYMNYVTYIDIPNLDTSITQNMEFMFSSLLSIENLDLSSLNTINVTDMNRIAYGNKNLLNISFHGIDTRNVRNMNSLLACSDNIKYVDLSGMDFRKYDLDSSSYGFITYLTGGGGNRNGIKKLIMDDTILPADMAHGFYYMLSVEEISFKGVDTSNVTTMLMMFHEDNSLKRIDGLDDFDTSNVTTMEWMFENCYSLEEVDLSSFDTKKVKSINAMFYDNKSLKKVDLSSFDVRSVTNFGSMFFNCLSLEEVNLSNWDFSALSNTSGVSVFSNMELANNSNLNLKRLILDNIKLPADAYYYFEGLKTVEMISINNPDLSDTRTVRYLFGDCPKLKELHLESFDTSEILVMDNMFWSLPELTTIYVGDDFKVNQVTSSTNMFLDDVKLVGGEGTVYDANNIDKTYAHVDGGVSNPGYFTSSTSTTVKTITFNGNGGSVSESFRNVGIGNKIGTLPIPSKKDATFIGWYTGLTDGEVVSQDYVVNTNQTLYARYAENRYTITLDANGGTSYETSRVVIEGKKIGTLPIPERNDYIFVGWVKGITSDVILNSSYIPQGNETLTAKWRLAEVYTITFNPNGGSVSPTSKTVKENKVVGNLPTPTIEGGEFRGWYTDLTAGTRFENSYLTDNITVYAKWRFSVDWQTSSWQDLIDAYKDYNLSDLTTAMNNGTTRELKMDLDNDGTEETYNLRIANLEKCTSSYSNTYSTQTSCGFVVEFADVIALQRMNPYDTSVTANGNGNRGGWKFSEMRTYLNDDTTGATSVYNALPSELKSKIIDTNVITGYGQNNSPNLTTTDKLYLFTPKEVTGSSESYDTGYSVSGIRQLDFYKNGGSIKKSGVTSYWWLRTPASNAVQKFYYVKANGTVGTIAGNQTTAGASPAFRLAHEYSYS